MLVAAVMAQQQGIADVVQRRAVLPGRQRAVGGTGNMLKSHETSFRAISSHVPRAAPNPPSAAAARLFRNPQVVEKLHGRPGNTNARGLLTGRVNVTGVTVSARGLAQFGRNFKPLRA